MWKVILTRFGEGDAEYHRVLHFENRYPHTLHLEFRSHVVDLELRSEDHVTVFPIFTEHP